MDEEAGQGTAPVPVKMETDACQPRAHAWALAVLDFRSKTITYYDSPFDHERSNRVLVKLMRWLLEYAAIDAAANGDPPAIDESE
jgi:Ulp1 protease family, C-terminal catalytic domain